MRMSDFKSCEDIISDYQIHRDPRVVLAATRYGWPSGGTKPFISKAIAASSSHEERNKWRLLSFRKLSEEGYI
jgi:hypothetical protein